MEYFTVHLVRHADGSVALVDWHDTPEGPMTLCGDGLHRYDEEWKGRESPAPTPEQIAEALKRYAASHRHEVLVERGA